MLTEQIIILKIPAINISKLYSIRLISHHIIICFQFLSFRFIENKTIAKYNDTFSQTNFFYKKVHFRVLNPNVRVSNTKVKVINPKIRVNNPKVKVYNLKVRVSNPKVRVTNPKVKVCNPNISVGNPNVAVQDPKSMLFLSFQSPKNKLLRNYYLSNQNQLYFFIKLYFSRFVMNCIFYMYG